MRLTHPLMAAAALLVVAACGSNFSPSPSSSVAPSPAASSVVVGGYTSVAVDDPSVQTAVDKGIPQLRGTNWLGADDLTALSTLSAEKQIVAGTNYRVTVKLQMRGKQRNARLVVYQDLQGAYRVTSVDLGPVGSDNPLSDVPQTSDAPGGWTEQDTGGAIATQAADQARTLLAGNDWLARPVTVDGIVAARSQVVAGSNVFLTLDAHVETFPQRIDLILYQPLQGAAELSWVRLEGEPPAR